MQAYKVSMEFNETITEDLAREWVFSCLADKVDRVVGLSFRGFSLCEFGTAAAAGLLVDHNEPVSPERVEAWLNVPDKNIRIVSVETAD